MAYFPALDRCLTGREPLISWHAVLNELTSDTNASDQLEIQTFLCEEEAKNILVRPSHPLSGRDEQSKQQFESKTAPIHVASGATAAYNLQQLKADALWLAKELDISELAALRVVLVEWQARPGDTLLGKIPNDPSRSKKDDDLGDVIRHRRLLQTYLQEVSAIKHIAAMLVALDTGSEALPGSGHEPWMLRLGDLIRTSAHASRDTNSRLMALTKEFERQTSLLEDNKHWPHCFQVDFALHADFSTAVLRDLASTLRMSLTYHFNSNSVPSAQVVLAWFEMMSRTEFLQGLTPPTLDQSTLVELLQCLVSVYSAALLTLHRAIVEIDQISEQGSGTPAYPDFGTRPYIADDACVRDINIILFRAAESQSTIACPALYAWSILTMYVRDLARMEQEAMQQLEDNQEYGARHGSVTRRHSPIESKFDALQDRSLGSARDDPPQYLARMAADELNVFAIIAELSRILASTFSITLELPIALISRTILLDVLRESLPTITYDEHIVDATLSLLFSEAVSPTCNTQSPSLAAKVWNDIDRWQPLMIQQAISRFPYETSPLVRLLSAMLGNLTQSAGIWDSVVQSFEELTSIVITLPEGFRGYTLEHEEDGANAFSLLDGLPIFKDQSSTGVSQMSQGDSMAVEQAKDTSSLTIPAGSHGVILRDSRPFIVSIRHGYSGLHYIGILLTTLLPAAQYTLSPPAPLIDNFVAADIMQLIVNLLQGASDPASTRYILEELSKCIPDELDITAIVSELLEVHLLARAEQSSQPGSAELIVQCLKYHQVLSKIFPERLWSYLSQGSLLRSNDGGNAILSAIGSADDDLKQSQLICECLQLYKTAVEDAIRGVVKRRKLGSGRKGNRFDSPQMSLGDISERVISQVLTSFTSLALQVLQSLHQSGQHYSSQRSRIRESIASTFTQLLVSVYGIGDGTTAGSGVTKVLAPAAQLMIDALLPDNLSFQIIAPLLASVVPVLQSDSRIVTAGLKTLLVEETRAVLKLLCVLMRLAKAWNKSVAKLNTALMTAMSELTSLFALQAPFQKLIAQLLTEMVSVDQGGADPVSIFSQLSQEQGAQFLGLSTRFDNTLTDSATETSLWALFAAACQHGQQWFAMYLVTGLLPKDQIKEKREATKTALSHALDLLSDLKNLNPERAAAMLRFVAEAQKTWTWATSIVRQHPDFLTSSFEWLKDLKPWLPSANVASQLLAAKEYQLAAALCDVLAVNVLAALELGDQKLCKDIARNCEFLTRHAARVNGYNQKVRLAENLAKQFPGVELADLKRTAINPGAFGNDYMYDIDTAAVILGHDSSWQSSDKKGATGFVDELAIVNINWSLYHAQVSLLKHWKTLAIAMSDSSIDDALSTAMVTTIKSCLTANGETNLSDPNAAELLQIRVDLAFSLLSRLIRSSFDTATTTSTDIINASSTSTLEAAWTLVKGSPADFATAQADADLTYYRTLLQVLYLALQIDNKAHAPTQRASQSASHNGAESAVVRYSTERESLLVEIMTRTVTQGFRSLCSNLHESVDCARPDDFALLTALAKAVLSGGTSTHFHNQIADVVAFSAVLRSAASLFSWSDRLANVTGNDPVYGELAVMFLVTLSRVRQVAEQMAVENILTQISSANLSNYFRKPGGKGPFDEPARMFVIWTAGFLPLCLNLIEAVGPPVTSQISSFFSSFPEQLSRAEKALQNATPTAKNLKAGAVTLGLVNEARDLTTIAQILKSTVELGAADGINIEDVQQLGYNTNIICDDLEAMTKSQRSLRDRVVPLTPREVALYNDKTGSGGDDRLQAAIIEVVDQTLALLV